MDQKLLFLINREWTNVVADRFMAVLSNWDAWLPVALLLIVILLVRGGFRARAFVVTMGLIVGFNDGVLARTLKRVVDRPRPHQTVNDVRVVELAKAKPRLLAVFRPLKTKLSRTDLADVEGRSFPSSHTVNMFSVALVALAFYGAQAWWTLALAAAVGYSRIYTGSHWPSDVVTSIFLGLGSSLLLLTLLEWLWRRRAGTLLPQVHAAHPSLFAA